MYTQPLVYTFHSLSTVDDTDVVVPRVVPSFLVMVLIVGAVYPSLLALVLEL